MLLQLRNNAERVMCQLQSAHSWGCCFFCCCYTHTTHNITQSCDRGSFPLLQCAREHLQVRKNLPIGAILLSRRSKAQHRPHRGTLAALLPFMPPRWSPSCLKGASVCAISGKYMSAVIPHKHQSAGRASEERKARQHMDHLMDPDRLNFAIIIY